MSELIIGMYKIESNLISQVSQCCKEVFFDLNVKYDIENIEDTQLMKKGYDILFVNIKEVIHNIGVETKKVVSSAKTRVVALADDVESLLYAFKLNSYRAMTHKSKKNEIKDIIETIVGDIYKEEKLHIQEGDEIAIVDIKDILYFEAYGDKSIVITKENEYISNKSLKYWDEKLKNMNVFFRCHKSYLAYKKNIKTIKESSIYFSNDKCIPISVRKRKEVKNILYV